VLDGYDKEMVAGCRAYVSEAYEFVVAKNYGRPFFFGDDSAKNTRGRFSFDRTFFSHPASTKKMVRISDCPPFI
jgi:hypothetical protein